MPNVVSVDDRAALAEINPATSDTAYLLEEGREGVFAWSGGDLSALVTADTQQGIYVASGTIASTVGAWVRLRNSERYYDASWFGVSPDAADCSPGLQGAIDLITFIRGTASQAVQTSEGGDVIELPAGLLQIGSRISLKISAIHIRGQGEGATGVEISASTHGFIRIRDDDYLNGGTLHNVILGNFRIQQTQAAYSAIKIGIDSVLLQTCHLRNILFTNLSRAVRLAAPQTLWIDQCDFSQRNQLLTGNFSDDIAIVVQPVDTGTAGEDINDAGVSSIHGAGVFLTNVNFSNPFAGTTRSNLYVQACDGLFASNCHFGGAQWQLQVDPFGHTSPFANAVFNSCDFDGVPSNTDRNVYIVGKTYTSLSQALHIAFNRCKFNNSGIEAIAILHDDWQEFDIHGGESDKASGNYFIRAAGGANGYGSLDVQHHKFRMGGGGPDIACILLDATATSFFKTVRIKSSSFYSSDTTTLPPRHIWIKGNGTNNGRVVVADNDYETSAALTSGFLQNDDTGAIKVIYDPEDNPSFDGNVQTVITAATHTVTPNEKDFICNRGGTITLTLPNAVAYPGRVLRLKTTAPQLVISAASNVCPITSSTAGTAILPATDGAWCHLESDGTNWKIMALH